MRAVHIESIHVESVYIEVVHIEAVHVKSVRIVLYSYVYSLCLHNAGCRFRKESLTNADRYQGLTRYKSTECGVM